MVAALNQDIVLLFCFFKGEGIVLIFQGDYGF